MPSNTPGSQSPTTPPPPVRHGAHRSIVLALAGVIIALLVLIVLMNIDRQQDANLNADTPDQVIDTMPPAGLTEDELQSQAARASDANPAGIGEIPGGWIQISDDEGALAQQYRFSHLDPSPPGMGPGWIHMTDPVMELYLSGGRVVTLSGDTARTFRSSKVIESGSLSGSVTVQLFEDIVGRVLDPAGDIPSLVMNTSEASFDNVLGEIECPGLIQFATSAGDFQGRRLRLLINDQDQQVHLRIAEVDFIRLAATPAKTIPAPPPDNPAEPPAIAEASTDPANPASAPTVRTPRAAAPSDPTPETAPEPAPIEDEPFYILTLHDSVRIVQGNAIDSPSVAGDSMSIIFTLKSKGLGASFGPAAQIDHHAEPSMSIAGMSTPQRMEQFILAAALSAQPLHEHSIAPPPSDDDTYVWCTGPLTVEPLKDRKRKLKSPLDARVEMVGSPVRFNDPGSTSEAFCGVLRYDTRRGRVELHSTEEHELHIVNPRFKASAPKFWYEPNANRGGFTGAGWMEMVDAPPADGTEGPRPAPQEPAHVRWSERVNLTFADSAGNDPGSALREAAFIGDVEAEGGQLMLPTIGEETDGEATSRPGAKGVIQCGQLALNFGASDDGHPLIEQVSAADHVYITDAQHTLWAHSVNVWFQPPTDSEDDPAEAGRTQVDHAHASGAVQLLLPNGQRIFADTLQMNEAEQTALVSGSDVRLVDGHNIIDRVELITLNQAAAEYAIEGPGRFRRFDQPLLETTPEPIDRIRLEAFPTHTEELRITWRDGVRITPAQDQASDPDTDVAVDAHLRRVHFMGQINIISPELKMTHANDLHAWIGGDDGADGSSSTLERIEASGAVAVRAVGEPRRIECSHLRIDLAADDSGSIAPTQFTATSNVHLSSDTQHMWCRKLTATFLPRPETPAEELAPSAPEPDEDFSTARVAIDTIVADDSVQIRMADGQRVFADRLVADAQQRTANLVGDELRIITRDFMLAHITRLELDDETHQYRVVGPGEFHAFASPIDVPDRIAPIEPPPTRDIPLTMLAKWSESAQYTEHEGGGGELDLRGAVDVRSQPSALEQNTISAGSVAITFVEIIDPVSGPKKDLARFLARGDARLESRTWRADARDDAPRVFYVAGQHIDYDQTTFEALIVGDGELLIRDEWIDEPTGAESEAMVGGIGAKGATLFRWVRSLRLTREVDTRFEIVMDGDVQCIHRDLESVTTTYSGQHLTAFVERDRDEAAVAEAPRGRFDIGGSMRMRRLAGSGGVVIRTTQRDVTCDEFDYNTLTGLAEITAAPGRTVSVLTEGSSRPFRAERLLWDMIRDRITIHRGAGSGGS